MSPCFGRIAAVFLVSCALLSGQKPAATASKPIRTLRPQQASAGQPAAPEEKRIALVIGNGAYKDSPLRNPVNDARAMAAGLRDCGFQVDLVLNADRTKMFQAVRDFGQKLNGGGVGLFYYAGHGMAVKGSNYLIPVAADIATEDEVEVQSLSVQAVLNKMEAAKNRLNLLILDACRNNPFGRSFRSGSRGLAQMDAPSGSFIAYATAPGSTASDGTGQNGLYTQHLLQALRQSDLSVEQVFKRVRVGVKRDSKDQQVPWDSSSLTGEFYFRQGDSASQPAAVPLIDGGAPAAPRMLGGLQVLVNAPEAQVYLDGELKGKASPTEALNLSDLPIGEVSVRVEAPGYRPQEQVFAIAKGQWTQAELVLPKQNASGHPSLPLPAGPAAVHSTSGPEALPPIAGAVRNAAGLWEVSVSLGTTSLEMVQIPAGRFRMGSENGKANERPAHEVVFDQPFWLGKYPVTQKQFKAVAGYDRSRFKAAAQDAPVEQVTASDCELFLSRLNTRQSRWRLRLPSEAEWEYACRAGTSGDRYGELDAIAWHAGNGGKSTHPVGQKQPNAFGLYDMLGNVWQWCADLQHDDYSNAPGDGQAWIADSYFFDSKSGRVDPGNHRYITVNVTRGGSWREDAVSISASRRAMVLAKSGNDDLGFRIAGTLVTSY